MLGRLPQTDGGYLGLDIEAFVSAVVSGAPGVFAAMLLQDASIETDLVVRLGQRVSLSGNGSLARPPRWAGGFTVQERASLHLDFVALSASATVSVSGGALSLARVAVPVGLLEQMMLTASAGSVLRLSEATVTETDSAVGSLTGSATVGTDVVFDPPGFEVRDLSSLSLLMPLL